jgi:hypothetical protein
MCDAWVDSADGVVCTATMPLVSYPVSIFQATLADGVQGEAYRGQVVASGGRPDYRYTVQPGSLPRGLQLDKKSGIITGTPKTNGTYSIVVDVTDSSKPTPETVSQTLSLEISPPE